MGTVIVAQVFESVNEVELCPDVAIRDMQWYWGVCPLTGLHQWFWVGFDALPQDMPNYLADEPPALDTKQGVSYHLDRGL